MGFQIDASSLRSGSVFLLAGSAELVSIWNPIQVILSRDFTVTYCTWSDF